MAVAAFRTATAFYKATMDHIDPQTQATWMLKFVTNNPAPSLLHRPCVQFAMVVRPKEFGFVSLCKALIEQGITDQCDLGVVARILRLPVVKNPADILKWFFMMSVTHKYLSVAARRCVQRPMLKFKDLETFKPWGVLFVKRGFQFIVYSREKKKYIRRIYLVIHLFSTLLTLKIDWLTEAIQSAASTVLSLEKCVDLLGPRFQSDAPIDEKMKEELGTVPSDNYDVKLMLDDVREDRLFRVIEAPDVVGTVGEKKSAGGSRKKPTIAEVKARYKQAREQGKVIDTTDLSLLQQDASSARSDAVEDDDTD
jgi:hypothetical protein